MISSGRSRKFSIFGYFIINWSLAFLTEVYRRRYEIRRSIWLFIITKLYLIGQLRKGLFWFLFLGNQNFYDYPLYDNVFGCRLGVTCYIAQPIQPNLSGNPQTIIALTFFTYIISAISGVELYCLSLRSNQFDNTFSRVYYNERMENWQTASVVREAESEKRENILC